MEIKFAKRNFALHARTLVAERTIRNTLTPIGRSWKYRMATKLEEMDCSLRQSIHHSLAAASGYIQNVTLNNRVQRFNIVYRESRLYGFDCRCGDVISRGECTEK